MLTNSPKKAEINVELIDAKMSDSEFLNKRGEKLAVGVTEAYYSKSNDLDLESKAVAEVKNESNKNY